MTSSKCLTPTVLAVLLSMGQSPAFGERDQRVEEARKAVNAIMAQPGGSPEERAAQIEAALDALSGGRGRKKNAQENDSRPAIDSRLEKLREQMKANPYSGASHANNGELAKPDESVSSRTKAVSEKLKEGAKAAEVPAKNHAELNEERQIGNDMTNMANKIKNPWAKLSLEQYNSMVSRNPQEAEAFKLEAVDKLVKADFEKSGKEATPEAVAKDTAIILANETTTKYAIVLLYEKKDKEKAAAKEKPKAPERDKRSPEVILASLTEEQRLAIKWKLGKEFRNLMESPSFSAPMFGVTADSMYKFTIDEGERLKGIEREEALARYLKETPKDRQSPDAREVYADRAVSSYDLHGRLGIDRGSKVSAYWNSLPLKDDVYKKWKNDRTAEIVNSKDLVDTLVEDHKADKRIESGVKNTDPSKGDGMVTNLKDRENLEKLREASDCRWVLGDLRVPYGYSLRKQAPSSLCPEVPAQSLKSPGG